LAFKPHTESLVPSVVHVDCTEHDVGVVVLGATTAKYEEGLSLTVAD
jgi:hypothetical protein